MIRALCTGTLYGSPQTRTSAAGKAFSIAKVKADDKGGAWVLSNVMVRPCAREHQNLTKPDMRAGAPTLAS